MTSYQYTASHECKQGCAPKGLDNAVVIADWTGKAKVELFRICAMVKAGIELPEEK